LLLSSDFVTLSRCACTHNALKPDTSRTRSVTR
jgi:hypothetical protein